MLNSLRKNENKEIRNKEHHNCVTFPIPEDPKKRGLI